MIVFRTCVSDLVPDICLHVFSLLFSDLFLDLFLDLFPELFHMCSDLFYDVDVCCMFLDFVSDMCSHLVSLYVFSDSCSHFCFRLVS
jgi:hypothetical protein